MWFNNSEIAGKNNNKIVSCSYFFVNFLYNFEFIVGFSCFPRWISGIMFEDLLYGYYSLPFELSQKVLQVSLNLNIFLIYTLNTYQAIFEWRHQKII